MTRTAPADAPRRARGARGRVSPLLLKLGGELLEQPDDVARVARLIAALARRAAVVVVHGGGKEIDAALAAAGIPKRQVDGLRVTDGPTLDVVVSVLAGAINTRLVAAVRRTGGKAVGLTGADAAVTTVRRADPIVTVSGETVDLGLVGTPITNGGPRLVADLLKTGYIPVIASMGATRTGELMNVNADTLASHLAAGIGADRLVIAGGTPGVLNEEGATIPRLTTRDAARLVKSGTASKGMVAKLDACRAALRRGVREVLIADGRALRPAALLNPDRAPAGCTQVVR
jgi:acetylglutamate kinase